MYDRYQNRTARYIPAGSCGFPGGQQNRPPDELPGGLKNLFSQLSSILPAHADTEDLLLLGLFLLLYLDSKDDDFLIFLAVIAFSLFKKD